MLSRKATLMLLLAGVLLVAHPAKLVSAQEDGDEYEDPGTDDEYEGEGGEGGDFDEKDVLVLNSDNFDKTVNGAKFALVEFYAPWCGHCKSLAPEYAQAATEIKEFDPAIVIAKVDATEEPDLAKKFGVEGYPTLKWFVNGKATEFGGGRDADAIVSWVKKKTGPPSTEVKSEAKLEELQDAEDFVVLGLFAQFSGADFEAFQTAAESDDKAVYVHTTNKALAAQFGVTAAPGLVLLKDFDDGNVVFSGKFDTDTIATFVNGEKVPVVVAFSEESAETIFGSGIKKQVLIFGDSEILDEGEPLYKAYVDVAKKLKGQLVFVTVSTETEQGKGVMEFFSVKDADCPALFGFDISSEDTGVKFKFGGEVNAASIESFAGDLIKDALEPWYKSEEPPAKNDGPVTVVVGKTFESIVLAEDKDVLLEVYAPWCGHCKKLAPIYTKLGKRFQSIDSVVIAKMDGTANEHSGVQVEGFPTLIFFPAKGGDQVDCGEGCPKTLKGLTKFIKENAAIPYELPKKGEGKGKDEL